MHIKYRQTCRICGNKHLVDVIDLGEQHFQGSFCKIGVPNPPTRKTPNLVVRCDTSKEENACGLIQTRHTIPPRILYTNYWYQSGISKTMSGHLTSIVNNCLDITSLKNGNVLDIGANDFTLLKNYSTSFRRIGVDPSDIALKASKENKDIELINDLFPSIKIDKLNLKFDIITSIACFYDIEDPKTFSRKISEMLSDSGVWVFEVAYWPTMLENLAYDSIVNEHIIHYHLSPLEIMFESLNLKIFNAFKTDTNGGSIMCFVTHKNNFLYDSPENQARLSDLRLSEFNAMLDDEKTYDIFRSRVKLHKEELIRLLLDIKSKGQSVHILGASTKLNTILGYCNIGSDLIKFAAERSPEKVGGRTISGINLISEDESRSMSPDYYLVGPYHFKKEILERERKLGTKAKFIFPLPRIEIL